MSFWSFRRFSGKMQARSNDQGNRSKKCGDKKNPAVIHSLHGIQEIGGWQLELALPLVSPAGPNRMQPRRLRLMKATVRPGTITFLEGFARQKGYRDFRRCRLMSHAFGRVSVAGPGCTGSDHCSSATGACSGCASEAMLMGGYGAFIEPGQIKAAYMVTV